MDIKEIEKILHANEEKAAEFKQALESAKDNGAKSDAEALSMAAAAVGIEISPEQIEQTAAASQTVSDEDLELVSGGEFDGSQASWCMVTWNCFTAFLHPDIDNTDVACWKNYACVISHEAGF